LLNALERGRLRRKRRIARVHGGIEVVEQRTLLAAAVQFDVSSVLNADVVLNKPAGGAIDTTQSPVYRNTRNGNWSLLTQSSAHVLAPPGSSPDGLPDNGFIAANAFHPDVQLAVNNASNGLNARRADIDGLVLPVSQFGFTLGVPQNSYQEVHVFLT